MVNSYRYGFSGFAAKLTEFQAKNFQFLLRVFQYFFNGVHVVAANSGNFLNLGVVAAAIDDHFDEAEGGFRTEGEEGVSGGRRGVGDCLGVAARFASRFLDERRLTHPKGAEAYWEKGGKGEESE
ncbi:uncharacterized protein LOC110765740 [Prunus avium]|uniref:Uncharacterized protein LOC110765740 n=1 Tax=Prunus avium TaxID=42229 RepID=A0A6P5TBQ8_PRUAV|nr:uncharacterized protein LOC110765740 [Prunus avium]